MTRRSSASTASAPIIVREVVRRVVQHYAGQPQKLLDYVLNEAGNEEIRRLAAGDLEASDALGFWRRLVKRLGKMNEDERKELRRTSPAHGRGHRRQLRPARVRAGDARSSRAC
jgi:hypothetical protein